MALHKTQKPKPKPRSPLLFFFVSLAAIAFLFLFSSLISINGASSSFPSSNSIQKIFRFDTLTEKQRRNRHVFSTDDKFLYWGNRIDCPGKHCDSCEGLGHQESSLRCALEEAMFLQRDTRPEFMLKRIAKWVPAGRTLFIASNERTPGFFSPLSARYKLAYSSNYSHILDPVVKNNYELFMIERVIMAGAKTFIRTFKEDDTDLGLTDDPKKNTKIWQIPVYTADEERS